MKTTDFSPGDQVRYVPYHAKGDRTHSDCENGVVTSINDSNVFVKYGDGLHAQATDPESLINLTHGT